jgi:heterodisulfide reductase subunit C
VFYQSMCSSTSTELTLLDLRCGPCTSKCPSVRRFRAHQHGKAMNLHTSALKAHSLMLQFTSSATVSHLLL